MISDVLICETCWEGAGGQRAVFAPASPLVSSPLLVPLPPAVRARQAEEEDGLLPFNLQKGRSINQISSKIIVDFQALGETGNDGDAAEKWLAEQAQVGSYLYLHLWPLSDYHFKLVSDAHFHLDSENHVHSGPRFGKGLEATGSKHLTGAPF